MSRGARILVVDDAPEVVALIGSALARDGYEIATASTGAEALEEARVATPDVVVLDVNLPDIDGLEVAARLRALGGPMILFVSARAEEADRISGLAAGGDDYVTKPFSPAELALRVRALLRRQARTAAGSPPDDDLGADVVRVGNLEVVPRLHEVRVGGRPVALTPIEYRLVDLLVRHPRQVLSRDRVMHAVWGANWYGARNVLDGHVSNLRRKLGDDPKAPRFIVAVRGVGFRLGSCESE